MSDQMYKNTHPNATLPNIVRAIFKESTFALFSIGIGSERILQLIQLQYI